MNGRSIAPPAHFRATWPRSKAVCSASSIASRRSNSRAFSIKTQPIETSFDIQTDGREIARSNRGLTSRSRLEWQGNSLLLTVLIDAPRGIVSNVVRYELLDDGRSLRAVEDVGGAAPTHHNVWMFVRQ